MDSLVSFVNSNIHKKPDADIRLTAKEDSDGNIQLKGIKKSWIPGQFACRKESVNLAQTHVKDMIAKVENPEIRMTLTAIFEKKMEGHKTLRLDALHSITAAYESLTNPDFAEAKAINDSKISYRHSQEILADEQQQKKEATTTYTECLDRLDVTINLLREKRDELDLKPEDKYDYRAAALKDKTLEQLEEQIDNLEELKDLVKDKKDQKQGQSLTLADQENIKRLYALLDDTNELVRNKINVNKLEAIAAKTSSYNIDEAIDHEQDIEITYSSDEDDGISIKYGDDELDAAFDEDIADILREQEEQVNDYFDVVDDMIDQFGNL
ncbi:hypothetical protein SG34_015150 [Thalassomonas viridans]|uniref:Uncharacterized protein n=1 Tax=Thalassomonas viridans TaxID=137584 RepID=A0AAE9YX32_9GAMM|nr:hypothetical protein [Thalassomonas viridans]WDE02781.1 hypothetical protein SG34_015150 [Thalassomonas viridans]